MCWDLSGFLGCFCVLQEVFLRDHRVFDYLTLCGIPGMDQPVRSCTITTSPKPAGQWPFNGRILHRHLAQKMEVALGSWILQDQLVTGGQFKSLVPVPGQPAFGEANDCGPGIGAPFGLVKKWDPTYSNKDQQSMVDFLGYLP